MDEHLKKVRVKVCVHKTCCMNGSEQIYEKLAHDLADTAEVTKTVDCFRFCKSGPNVSVNGTILQGVHLADATTRIKREIIKPSRKVEGAGTKSIDELDDVLESFFL